MKLSLCFLLLPMFALAQHKYDNIWLFGPWKGYGTILNFSSDNKIIENVDFAFDMNTGSSMIANESGVLQYYSNGCHIADGSHEIVQGANWLNPGWYYDNYCFDGFGYPYGDQSMVLLPFKESRYSLIAKHRNHSTESEIRNDILYRSEIQQNSVQFINKEIARDTFAFACIAAIPHVNQTDYWIVTPHDSSDIYFSIHLGPDSLHQILKQYIPGLFRRNHNDWFGKFSPDGTLYIGYEGTYLEQSIKVFSFDRSTGLLTLLYTLPHPEEETSFVGGMEFSPSGEYLYISTWDTIYQYDLKAKDVLGSKTVVAIWDGFTDSFPCTFNAMQRGPDCRIYINSPNSQKCLHVIMHPDVKGPDCEVLQHEIPLYYYHQISMPYFPNYRLGTGQPVCDSTLSLPTSIPVVSLPEEGLRIWPNPASGDCRVMLAPGVLRSAVSLDVVDMWGRSVLTRDLSNNYNEVIPIDLSRIVPGIYFIRIIGRQGERWVERLVVE